VYKQRYRINLMYLLRTDWSLLALPNSKPAMRKPLVMRENRGGGMLAAINNTYIFYLFIINDSGLLSVVPLLGAVKLFEINLTEPRSRELRLSKQNK